MGLSISEAQYDAWKLAEDKGFHEGRSAAGRDDTLVRLCLVHTEISEAAQEVKRHWDGEPTHAQLETFGEEMADAAIRIFDLCGCVGVDLAEHIIAKMIKNGARPYKYGTPNAEAPDGTRPQAYYHDAG